MTQRIFDKAQITALELDESLINANQKLDTNGNYRMDVRVRFVYESTQMTEEEKAIFADMDDDDAEIVGKLGRNDAYTCLFPALQLLGEKELGAENLKLIKEMLATDGLDEDTQKQIFDKCDERLKKNGEYRKLPFTTYVVPIVDVLKDTEFQFGVKDGKRFEYTAIHSDSRGYASVSRSYFGLHSDTENATQSIIRRTLRKIEDGTYNVGNTDKEAEYLDTTTNTAANATEAKPKLKL